VKRADLLRIIGAAARDAGLRWQLVRQGSNHEVWRVDGLHFVIPRHREVNERTAREIMRLLEDKLGRGWWRT
jgi:hypothetical protein